MAASSDDRRAFLPIAVALLADWALWPCAWCWATLVSIMAGVLTDFHLPILTGAAFALVLPAYIADRIWLERHRRYPRPT